MQSFLPIDQMGYLKKVLWYKLRYFNDLVNKIPNIKMNAGKIIAQKLHKLLPEWWCL